MNNQTSQTQAILAALFPNNLQYTVKEQVIIGSATTSFGEIKIIGTVDSAAINHHIALTIADEILAVIAKDEQTPVVFVVDTQGQVQSRADELLCLNKTFAHLACCVDLLRRSRHPNFAIIFGEAVSGGFLSYGLMANQVFALNASQVKVMDLNAMSRVTKIPLEQLQSLSQSSAIFAPGVENFYKMGAIDEIWQNLSGELIDNAIQAQMANIDEFMTDNRRVVAKMRQGRLLCDDIITQLISAS